VIYGAIASIIYLLKAIAIIVSRDLWVIALTRHWVTLIKDYNLYIAIIIVNMGQRRIFTESKIFNDISRFSEVAN